MAKRLGYPLQNVELADELLKAMREGLYKI
jgi:hypothetical protein